MDIWDKVLQARPEYADKLVAMLDSEEPRYLDVAAALRYISGGTVTCIRQYLQITDRDSPYWYYSRDEKALVGSPHRPWKPIPRHKSSQNLMRVLQNPGLHTVIAGLGREGKEVTPELWRILTKFEPLRTAQEEARERLILAPRVYEFGFINDFAKDVRRLLVGCMQACGATRGLTVEFVQGGSLRLDLITATPGKVLVHDKWLWGSSAEAELALPPGYNRRHTLPSLAVRKLFTQLIRSLPADYFKDHDTTMTIETKRECEESKVHCLLSDNDFMMRNTRLEMSSLPCSLVLRTDGECGWAKDGDSITVHCHDANRCGDMRMVATRDDFCK